MKTKIKTWTATRYKNLYKHRSGTYYARLKVAGKLTWRTLGTKLLSVAQHELSELLKDQERISEVANSGESWKLVDDAIAGWRSQFKNDASTKDSTKDYWNEIEVALRKSWPDLGGTPIPKVKPSQCEAWAGRYSKQVSPSRYNNTLGALKAIFELAVDGGFRRANPAKHLKRVKPSEKDLTTKLPDSETFGLWVEAIRTSPNRWANDCADLVEFLSYTGLRIGEARHVIWRHCDRKRGEILVMGSPKKGTKNGLIRRVPIIANFADLLSRIETRIGKQAPYTHLVRVSVARKAMTSAAEKVGMEPITHHDLRHLFATICIESGVDIPTVSKWLGHKDGGALAMKVYGHLRNEHSLEMAQKVRF